MTLEKKRGRPKGSKNKAKEKIIELTIEEQPVIIKKRGRPLKTQNKPTIKQEVQEGDSDLRLVWEHLSTGFQTYINLKNNLELHKEDIPIFAADYRERVKNSPNYTVINVRNKHLIPYIQKEFPGVAIGYLNGVALWELRFCSG